MENHRLEKQIQFIVEIDALKAIMRKTLLTDCSRQENSAEHSWHLAVMAILLRDYASEAVDLVRVMKMVLVHDIVEIDAGDTYCYDEAGIADQRLREEKAAGRVFGLLPEDQGREFRNLWEEFEARESPEARFAAALDRLQPILQNFHSEGESCKEHGIKRHQVISRNQPMTEGAPELWDYAVGLLDEATKRGDLPE